MKITPENIIKQELIGLNVHVKDSSDQTHICRSGIVVDESKEMFQLSIGSKRLFLPKRNTVFEFSLPDGHVMRVKGDLLRGRSEERMKKHPLRRW